MSKLKSALLLSVALSPIFVSATRGIEVVHAEVVQNVVAQQVKKAAEVKPAKDNKLSMGSDENSQVTSKVNKDAISLNDENFQKKFQSTKYFQQQKAMYGTDIPKDDATLAAQTVGYIGTLLGTITDDALKNSALQKALGFAGPLGALLGFIIDLCSPGANDIINKKLDALDKKLDALGIHMDNDSQAVGEIVEEKSINTKLDGFRTEFRNVQTPFNHVALQVANDNTLFDSTLTKTNNKNELGKYVDDYAVLYSSPKYGVDNGGLVVKKERNTTNYDKLFSFSTKLINANDKGNDVFQLMADYESLKEYFNTQTFATRDVFAEDVMSHYSVWVRQMQTAILVDYNRIMGQIESIESSDSWKNKSADERQKEYPLTNQLLIDLKSDARMDLAYLGFDTVTPGHSSYQLDDFVKNNWLWQCDPHSVMVDGKYNVLSANAGAVSYAYANSVKNDPIKTLITDDGTEDYRNKLLAAQQNAKKADEEVEKINKSQMVPQNQIDLAIAAQKKAHAELDAISKYAYLRVTEKGKNGEEQALPGKLTVEEKISGSRVTERYDDDDSRTSVVPLTYSYRNKKWIYTSLNAELFVNQKGSDTSSNVHCDANRIPAWYAAKYFANKYHHGDIETISGFKADPSLYNRTWKDYDPLDNNAWNMALDHVMAKKDIEQLNNNAFVKGKGGVNGLIALNKSNEQEGVWQRGFSGSENWLISDEVSLDGSKNAGPFYYPTYDIGLGYYMSNNYSEPNKETKTLFQDFACNIGSAEKLVLNSEKHAFNPVCFIMVAKDGDTALKPLNNGNKVPAAPETYVNND